VHHRINLIIALEKVTKLAQLRPPISHHHGCPSAPSNLLDHGLRVYLQTQLITASQYISELVRLWPPCFHDQGLQVHLPISSIIACKCISKLARLRPPSSNDHGAEEQLQTHSITASECISIFTSSLCGEALELERTQPIINSLLHFAWHPKEIREEEQFCAEEGRKRVRGCERIPRHDEPHRTCGSMKVRQKCMRPRAGKD
jgi:hypothetical protein